MAINPEEIRRFAQTKADFYRKTVIASMSEDRRAVVASQFQHIADMLTTGPEA